MRACLVLVISKTGIVWDPIFSSRSNGTDVYLDINFITPFALQIQFRPRPFDVDLHDR